MIGAAVGVLLLLQGVQDAEVVRRARLTPGAEVEFRAIVVPETVYVGQQATYELGVFIGAGLRARLRRNPEFVPPDARSLLAYDLPEAGGPALVTVSGQPWEVHVFRRALFALIPGRVPIGRARLTYAVPQSASFFSREETRELRASGLMLTVIDPPEAGRPVDWAGAVGQWGGDLRVEPGARRPGEPITVRLVVRGTGNVALLPRPPLAVAGAEVVAVDERVALDSSPVALAGEKVFDWLVTPAAGGTLHLPVIRLPYFDPLARRYAAVETGPLDLEIVGTGDVAPTTPPAPRTAAGSAPAGPPMLVLRTPAGPGRPPVDGAPWRWLLLLAPVPALLIAGRRRPARAGRQRTAGQRLDHALAAGERDPGRLRHLLLDALGERLAITAADPLDPAEAERRLRREGVTDATAQRVAALLGALDAAAYGGAVPPTAGAPQLRALWAAVDREARRALGVMLVVLGLTVGARRASAQDGVLEAMARGQAAFSGRDWRRAATAYEQAARLAPRDPAIWANLGTAAWMAGDTAQAVTGWQRALRLDPLRGVLRDRLALVRPPQDQGAARVPPVIPWVPGALVIAGWLALWGWAAVRAARRRPLGWRVALPAAVLAAGAAWAWDINRRLAAEGLAVVATPTPLRRDPVLADEGSVQPMTGEVVTVVERAGPWTRVRLDAGSDGWIPADALLPLAIPAPLQAGRPSP